MAEVLTPARGELATIGQRVGAKLIDWVLLFASTFAIILPFTERIDGEVIEQPRVPFVCWMLLIALYEVVPTVTGHGTPGKWITRIRIVDAKTGANPRLIQALLRVLPVLAIVVIVPGSWFPVVLVFVYFTAAFAAEDHRGLLDRLAGTGVVRVDSLNSGDAPSG